MDISRNCVRVIAFSSANATPDFEGRGGENLAIEISNCLASAYKSRNAFDLEQLSILAGRKCWKIYVDILVRKQQEFVLTSDNLFVCLVIGMRRKYLRCSFACC